MDLDNNWKYIKNPNKTIRDVREDIDKEYKSMKIDRPEGFYGFWTEKSIKAEREKQQKAIKDKQKKSDTEM